MATKLVLLEYKRDKSQHPVAPWYADIVVKRKQGKVVGPAPIEAYAEKDKAAAIEAGYVKAPSKGDDDDEDERKGPRK